MVNTLSLSPISTPGSLVKSSSTTSSTPFPMTSSSSDFDRKIKSASQTSSDLSPVDSDEPTAKSTISSTIHQAKSKGKRKADEVGPVQPKKKAKKESSHVATKKDGEGDHEKGIFCHQCRSKKEADNVLRCTRFRTSGVSKGKVCNMAFCKRDLKIRYSLSPESIIERGRKVEDKEKKNHDPDSDYIFSCPVCLDDCQCSACRKKKGLEPLGQSNKSVGDDKTKVTKAQSGVAKNSTGENAINIFDSGSDLSEILEVDVKAVQKASKKAAPPDKKKTKKQSQPMKGSGGALSTPKLTTKAVKVTPKTSTGTPKKAKDVKGKVPNGSATKSKAKPVKKIDIPVEPPVFDKVDTRLGREEAEQRIELREYIFRFRPVLSVPDRSLGPLDDFDRPLTEASVRLFAGAMLDLIRDDLEGDTLNNQDLINTIVQHREELRYYADLARFANIYNTLAPLLRLRLPSPVAIRDRRMDANASALKAILDLDEDSPAPSWAEIPSAPSRRVGASRIPQPAEVTRMILAFVDRTLSTRKIRGELDSPVGEFEARRKHASQQKAETSDWEGKKKKLMEAGVRAKTAAEARANKDELKKHQQDHAMRMALLNVNLRAQLNRKSLRHEALGTDLDGRVYYALTSRMVDEDTKPPFGWASGLLVWGKGVPSKPAAEYDPGYLPPQVERWTHFGRSEIVKHLVKWLAYVYKGAITAAKPVKMATPKKTPNGKAILGSTSKSKLTTPKSSTKVNRTSVQTTLTTKSIPNGTSTTPRRTFEIVIPVSAKKLAASGSVSTLSSVSDSAPVKEVQSKNKRASDDSDSSTSSMLSSVPESNTPDFSDLIVPEGHKFSAEIIEEQGKELISRLTEVAEWLEVLEWKGLGEI